MENHIKILGVLPRIQYIANGENATFEFPFAIFKNENIEVYFDDVLQNSNTYTVSGAGQTEGGNVTFSSAPAQGTVVTLYRNLDIERTTDFQEGGALRANALNYELDYQTACQQQIADSLNRSILLPPYAISTNVDLSLPLPQAGKAIVWNANGTNLENSTVEVNNLEAVLLGYRDDALSAKTQAQTSSATAVSAAEQAVQAATSASQSAAAATETLSDKADIRLSNVSSNIDYITSTYGPDTNGYWYREYKSGWVEQGGITPVAQANSDYTVTFLKPFAAADYYVGVNYLQTSNGYVARPKNRNKTYVVLSRDAIISTANPNSERIWFACGMGE